MLDFLLLAYADLLTSSNVLAAFALAVSIIALSFMAGEMFSMPSLRGFAKSELGELGVSAVILLLAALLILPNGPFDMVARGFMLPGVPVDSGHVCKDWAEAHGSVDILGNWDRSATNPGNDAFAQADFFLGCRPDFISIMTGGFAGTDGVILGKLTYGYHSLMLNEMFLGFLSGVGIGVQIPLRVVNLEISIMPFVSLTLLNDIHTLIVDFIGTLWAAFAAQKMLLLFIEESSLQVFLPFGLLLRAIPFTRKTGSTIIAVVFAAYFIFPLSILVNQQIWEMIVNPQPAPGGTLCKPNDAACSIDTECCGGMCRAGKCTVPLTDFTEYRSVYSVCYGKDPSVVANHIGVSASYTESVLEDAYFAPLPPSSTKWSRTSTRLVESTGEVVRKSAILSTVAPDLLANMVLPSPEKANNAFFMLVEALLVDTSKFAMIALLFIVTEIVITLTLMKDFALLIGGEPRLFGITKLV